MCLYALFVIVNLVPKYRWVYERFDLLFGELSRKFLAGFSLRSQ